MNARTTSRIATLLLAAVAAAGSQADTIEELYSIGNAGRLHEAAGVFLPVFDDSGSPMGESVFLLNGGYPPVLDAEPIADVWLLDEDHWERIPTTAPAMAGHALVASADGCAHALGGVGADDWLRPLNTAVRLEVRRTHGRYEVEVEEVTIPGQAPQPAFGATAVGIDGGTSILLVGGARLGNPLSPEPGQLWEYRIDTNRWTRRADMPLEISGHSAAVAADALWVFGGEGSQGLSNEIYRYDISTDSWTRIGAVGVRPDPRRDHRAVAAGDDMLIFGGIEVPFFPETVDDVWQFNLDSLTWTRRSSLPNGLAAMAVDLIPNRMSALPKIEVLLYGGVIDAWSFPLDLSDSTLVYSSDLRAPRELAESPHQASIEN